MERTPLQILGRMSKLPAQTPENMRGLMEKMNLDERAFALVMNVSPATVRLWLCGAVRPCSTSVRLMQVYAKAPDIINRICEDEDGC